MSSSAKPRGCRSTASRQPPAFKGLGNYRPSRFIRKIQLNSWKLASCTWSLPSYNTFATVLHNGRTKRNWLSNSVLSSTVRNNKYSTDLREVGKRFPQNQYEMCPNRSASPQRLDDSAQQTCSTMSILCDQIMYCYTNLQRPAATIDQCWEDTWVSGAYQRGYQLR